MGNEKSKATVMSLAGIYLAYTGVELIVDVIEGKPDNMYLLILAGVVFAVVGVWLVISKIRTVMHLQQEEALLSQEEAESEDDIEAEIQEGGEQEPEYVDTDTDAFEREVERMIDEFDENKK